MGSDSAITLWYVFLWILFYYLISTVEIQYKIYIFIFLFL